MEIVEKYFIIKILFSKETEEGCGHEERYLQNLPDFTKVALAKEEKNAFRFDKLLKAEAVKNYISNVLIFESCFREEYAASKLQADCIQILEITTTKETKFVNGISLLSD